MNETPVLIATCDLLKRKEMHMFFEWIDQLIDTPAFWAGIGVGAARLMLSERE